MDPFTIFFPNHLLGESETRIGLQALSQFFYDLTPKHRKRIVLRLTLDALPPSCDHWLKSLPIVAAWNLPEREGAPAGILFFPGICEQPALLTGTLAAGLPFIGYDKSSARSLIDHSCGILISTHQEDAAKTFSHVLKMLYFDPGACRMLKKGALRRYHFLNRPVQTARMGRPSFA